MLGPVSHEIKILMHTYILQLSHLSSLWESQRQLVPSRGARSTEGNLLTFSQIRSSINFCLLTRIDRSFSSVSRMYLAGLYFFNGLVSSQKAQRLMEYWTHISETATNDPVTAIWSRNLFAKKRGKHISQDAKGGAEGKEARTQFSHQEEAPFEAEREKRNAQATAIRDTMSMEASAFKTSETSIKNDKTFPLNPGSAREQRQTFMWHHTQISRCVGGNRFVRRPSRLPAAVV